MKEGGGRFHWLGLSADYCCNAFKVPIARLFLFAPFVLHINARNPVGVNNPCRYFQNIFFLCWSGKKSGYTF